MPVSDRTLATTTSSIRPMLASLAWSMHFIQGMRTMLAVATAGTVALIMMMGAGPVDAARRRDNMEDFCRKAYDLCVFTCSSGIDCPSASDGYVCESRHGSLVVVEDGKETYYEADYSLCWHESWPEDDPLPDPEYKPVPRWPGDGERAMCMGCQRDLNVCERFTEHVQEKCLSHNTRYYNWVCDKSMYRHGVPSGRTGKSVDVSPYCKRRLRAKKRDDEFHVRADWDAYFRSLDECEQQALELCLSEYHDDHTETTTENTIEIGIEHIVKAGFKSVKEVKWGGRKGFYSACVDIGGMMNNECMVNNASCMRDVSPENLCRNYRGRHSR